jgi:hypothetical protein
LAVARIALLSCELPFSIAYPVIARSESDEATHSFFFAAWIASLRSQ